MATRFVFHADSGQPPSTNFARLTPVHATERRRMLAFDATTAQAISWVGVAPQGLTGTLTAIVKGVMASAVSGGIAFSVEVEAITPGDSMDMDAANSYDTVNIGTLASVPGTAGYLYEVSVTLTNADGIAAGDAVRFRLTRAVANAADTAAGDAYVETMEIRDAA